MVHILHLHGSFSCFLKGAGKEGIYITFCHQYSSSSYCKYDDDDKDDPMMIRSGLSIYVSGLKGYMSLFVDILIEFYQ